MSKISTLISSIEQAKNRRENGLINSIYWGFDKLTDDKLFPGWVKGKYYCVTANTSVNT